MTRHPIPEDALAAHLAILGKTGAGKSYAARSTVERLLAAGGRACIVDPTGVWWGLRLRHDGEKRSRFQAVIAGGRHGDVTLAEGDGPALARIIGTSSTPMILDVSAMTVSARTRFFTAFAETLLIENTGPLHLVLDEAHLFAPQTRVQDPSSAMMVHATNNLVALGRARGLRIILLSQRPAKLHKDSLTQVETLVAMRLVAPQDRKAVEEWIAGQADKKEGAEIIASLPRLSVGEAWIWAPAVETLERATFPAIATFDSMRPEAQGARYLPPVDVEAIQAALASEDIKTEAAPKGSSKARPAAAITADLAAAEQRGYERGYSTGARHAAAEARHALQGIVADIARFEQRLDSPLFYRDDTFRGEAPAAERGKQASLAPAVQPAKRAVDPPRKSEEPTDLNSASRKMLGVLDTNPPVRRSWRQIATLAGLKARGGHFNAGRKTLLDRGLVAEDAGLVRISEPSAGAAPEAIDPAALVETWAGVLAGAAPRILRFLFEAAAATRAEVAEGLSLQPRGGHWNAAWKELRDNALIVETGETVRLSELFADAGTEVRKDTP